MADITSDDAPHTIDGDGSFDIINLTPGLTYWVKFWGSWQTTTLTLSARMPDGTYVNFDDANTQGIDGTVSEFQLVMPGTVLRIAATGTGTPPSIGYSVNPKKPNVS